MTPMRKRADENLPNRIDCPHCGRRMLSRMQLDQQILVCAFCASRITLREDQTCFLECLLYPRRAMIL